jgi:hypothetical protein
MKPQKPHLGSVAALLGLSLAVAPHAAVDPNFHVYLAFGQSNMEGQGQPFPAATTTAIARFKVMSPYTCSSSGVSRTQNQWAPAVTPIVRCNTNFSLLDYFGRTLVDSLPGVTVGVVPAAVAGTAIDGFISSGAVAYYNGKESWMQSIATSYNKNPYAALIASAKVAQQTGVIKGILLHQGETDAYSSAWSDKVKTIYNSMLSDLGLKAADCPLLAGEVAPTGVSKGANPTIDALPKTIPTAYVISSAGTTVDNRDGQNVHFDVASYTTLGKRYAAQMLKLLPRTPVGVRSKSVAFASDADFVVYDLHGSRVAGFHATDAGSLETSMSGIRKNLPKGIYWVRNSSTGFSERVASGL